MNEHLTEEAVQNERDWLDSRQMFLGFLKKKQLRKIAQQKGIDLMEVDDRAQMATIITYWEAERIGIMTDEEDGNTTYIKAEFAEDAPILHNGAPYPLDDVSGVPFNDPLTAEKVAALKREVQQSAWADFETTGDLPLWEDEEPDRQQALWHDQITLQIDPREMKTQSADYIVNSVLPILLKHFLWKNAQYGDQHRYGLGPAAEWVGIDRKIHKLERALWNGEPIMDGAEDVRTMLYELVGQVLLTLDLLDGNHRPRGRGPALPE